MSLDITGFITTPDVAGVEDVRIDANAGAYAGHYKFVDGTGPGALSWSRQEITSPYVHGTSLVTARKDVVVMPLVIRVYATTAAQLIERTALLCRCFEQFRYRVGITIDEQDWEWYCQMADYAPGGGEWDKFSLAAHQQVYTFQVPREPTPIEGAH